MDSRVIGVLIWGVFSYRFISSCGKTICWIPKRFHGARMVPSSSVTVQSLVEVSFACHGGGVQKIQWLFIFFFVGIISYAASCAVAQWCIGVLKKCTLCFPWEQILQMFYTTYSVDYWQRSYESVFKLILIEMAFALNATSYLWE